MAGYSHAIVFRSPRTNRRVPARRFIGPTLLFVAVVLFYWKFTLSGQYEWMWSPDHAQQVVPWLNVAARQWHQGTFPWWDPHMWGGQPLLEQRTRRSRIS